MFQYNLLVFVFVKAPGKHPVVNTGRHSQDLQKDLQKQ